MTSEEIGRSATPAVAGGRVEDAVLRADQPGSVDGRWSGGGGGDTAGGKRRASVTIDGTPFPIAPHHCFACGALNVEGLGLALHIEGDTCFTELVLPDRFEGWEGIAHGGIVCTILDEVMAWSLAARDAWSLTARMTVDFKRPVRIGVPIRAEGRLVNARRRLMDTAARLVDPSSGELLAVAEAVYVVAPPDQRAELKRRYGLPTPETTVPQGRPLPRSPGG